MQLCRIVGISELLDNSDYAVQVVADLELDGDTSVYSHAGHGSSRESAAVRKKMPCRAEEWYVLGDSDHVWQAR